MPNIRHCCIIGCPSNSRRNPQMQFFQFPRPENPYYPLWKKACQDSLQYIMQKKKPVLCALHFQPRCIGGRRLISSAIPTLRLYGSNVAQKRKAAAAAAKGVTVDDSKDSEDTRKVASINAVVFEWLVRANLNPQLRGSITHGMIKEKAIAANHLIGCVTFNADNRWLHDFRQNYLSDFALKLSNNELMPKGDSLWVPDIVKELEEMAATCSSSSYDDGAGVNGSSIQQEGEEDEEDDDDDDDEDNTQEDENEGNAEASAQELDDYDEEIPDEEDAEEDLSPRKAKLNGNPAPSFKGQMNGHNSKAQQEPSAFVATKINSYSHALEWVKNLADFAIINEDFRCLMLLDKLQSVLMKHK